MKILCRFVLLLAATLAVHAENIEMPPSDVSATLMRGGPGRHGAARAAGAVHAGIDIVANQSSPDRELYRIVAVHGGRVVYARVNGSETEGYGFTVVIDHGNDVYSLYAHLATEPSQQVVAEGAVVKSGQVIGYLADLGGGHKSSGNVAACIVAPYDKIQLHFELFSAPSGREGLARIADFKSGGAGIDPTDRLRELGYGEFPAPTAKDKKQAEKQCSAELSPLS